MQQVEHQSLAGTNLPSTNETFVTLDPVLVQIALHLFLK